MSKGKNLITLRSKTVLMMTKTRVFHTTRMNSKAACTHLKRPHTTNTCGHRVSPPVLVTKKTREPIVLHSFASPLHTLSLVSVHSSACSSVISMCRCQRLQQRAIATIAVHAEPLGGQLPKYGADTCNPKNGLSGGLGQFTTLEA